MKKGTYPIGPRGERVYCAARSRKQAEAATWGASNIGCAKLAVTLVREGDDEYPVCRVHVEAVKRYGWNRDPYNTPAQLAAKRGI